MDSTKMKICYHISQGAGKSYFNRIGVAFVNKDGSLNVKLNCFPVNGEIHIRDYQPFAERSVVSTRETVSDQETFDFKAKDDDSSGIGEF
jgi:hypothetical protein